MSRIWAVLVAACMLAACATTEDVVPVHYQPSDVAQAAAAGTVKLVVVDGRTMDRSRISTKINGYGMNMGAVRSEKEIPEVVREALRTEFERRGFAIAPDGRAVTATVERFYNEYSAGVVSANAAGDVELAVTVTGASGAPLFSGTYKGVSKASVFLATASNAAESVAAALKDAISKMFADPAFRQSLTAG